jgi:UDP-N-acetylmuramoyl-L-alanyl-D-glutamate--2,6-diaminopimelate ligase
VGVTGTNGKTTIATLLYDLYRRMGHRVGLISTVVYRIDERSIPSTHTTPDVLRLNAMLREMVDSGCDYCFMEVSSHSVVQERIRGLHFAGAIFTNLTHDHLDYHGSMAEYIKAKKRLFDSLPKTAFALVNADDRNGDVMLLNTRARGYRYSLRQMADFRCKVLEMLFDGMLLRMNSSEVWVNFLGRFNAYNLTAVAGAAILLGADEQEVLQHLSALHSVSGRFEPVRSDSGITAIVDYAHTPDALQNVIDTINDIRCEGQRLIVVCGCGGDRDSTKRSEMGRIASREADIAVFTSDNPRTEDPEAILDQIVAGVEAGRQTLRITDRRQAIRTAVMLAKAGDILLVAGKGHEDYQIIGTEKLHFDDREELRAAFGGIQKTDN